MGMAMLRKEEEGREGSGPAGEALVFDKLRELTRNGYVPDSASPSKRSGILLRHPTGPDLILQADGSIDLPLGQTAKSAVAPSDSAAARPRMSKLRTLMILILAATFWFLSVAITATILEAQ
jgi:hypothetical protein